ncbi:Aos1 [Trypoxylus dichotomus]
METKMFMVNSNLNTIGGELDELQPEIMQHSVFRSLRKCGWREVPWKRYVVLSFDLVACEDLNPNLTARELEQLPPFSMKVIHTKKENGIDMRNKCVPPNLNGKHSLLSTGPLGTEETKRKLRQRIKELQGKTEEICENKENSTSLGGIEINSYDDKESLEQSVQVIDNSKAMKITENEFNNDGDFYTTIDNLSYTVEDTTANIEAHEQENAIGFETFGSDVFADYSKKLYLILEESECTDIRKFDDYGCKSLIEDKYIETSQNYLQLPDETLMKQYGWLAHFVIRHFDTYLDYLEYFVDDTCIYKKTNCIKILLHQGTIEYAENYHSEDDYYNEDEITYSNETIIGHAPEIYADLLPDPAENEGNKGVVVTNEVETLEKSTKTESSIEDNNKIDTLLSNEYLSKSPFNIATIQDIFSAFTYINEHLKSNKNGEDIIADVVSYLRNFNSFNLRLVLNSNDIKHQAYAIYECIIRMLTILALNKATAAEQQEAYEKSADIQRQLKILVNRDKKPKVLESKKEVAVDSIPSFFGNTIKAPIIKDKEAPDEHVNLKDIHDATEKTYSVKEAKAFEKVQECILMEVDSEGDDKASTKEEPKSFRRENTQPFIFDAWQIKKQLTATETELYDRQIRLWGIESQEKLRAANVLLIGARGLGSEIIKDILLSGINSLTILDNGTVTEEDRLVNFLMSSDSIGKNIAKTVVGRARPLNPLVKLKADIEPLDSKDKDYFKQFTVVIGTRLDFQDHEYYEDRIKLPRKRSHDEKTKSEPITVKVHGKSKYVDLNTVVKHSKTDKVKKCRNAYYYLMLVLLEFRNKYKREPLHTKREEDLANLKSIWTEMSKEYELDSAMLINEDEVFELVFGEIAAICSIVGGIITQEAIKAVSGKEVPINNVFLLNPLTYYGKEETMGVLPKST